MTENNNYQEKKAFYQRVLTIYGRNAVLEALQDPSLDCHCVHLAESNRQNGPVSDIKSHARRRDIPLKMHTRAALARISKNGKQDQGVAADIVCPGFDTLENYLQNLPEQQPARLLALDGVSNPQNLGMIVRAAAAGDIDGILWSRRGTAALGPLVIKASAGTLYKAPMLICPDLVEALTRCRSHGMDICTLEADAAESLFSGGTAPRCVYVLGNESEGVSKGAKHVANRAVSIPMNNDVESLNVAVTAALIAYAGKLG